MAIQKEKVLLNGVSGNCWVIENISVSADLRSVRAMAMLFADSMSVSGVPIHETDIVLNGVDNPLNRVKLANLIEQKLVTMSGDFYGGIVI